LFGLLILDGCRPLQAIEVVLEERLFAKRSGGGLGGYFSQCSHGVCGTALFYNAVDIARDKLEPRILISRAALIVEGYPAVEIDVFVFAVEHRDIVGLPGDPLGEVGRLDLLRRSTAVFQ
jgi:hypothetical protein